MNYTRIYNSLIERARERLIVGGYMERHHIIPKCLGGTDAKENLVDLTPEEHFLAHQLLVKMHPGNTKLVFAAHAMTMNHSGARVNNKMFGWLKREKAKAHSLALRGIPKSEEAKAKMRAAKASPEAKQRIAEANRARVVSDESRLKMSIAKRGKRTPGMTGKRHSEETKLKMRLAKLKNKDKL